MKTRNPYELHGGYTTEVKNEIIILFDEYINERRFCSNLSDETIRGYEAVFELFLKIMPEITDAQFLTPEMLVEFFKRLATRDRPVGKGTVRTGVQVSTIKTYWSRLNCFFNWLKTKSRLKENPLKKVVVPKPSFKDMRALEDADVRKLYSAVTLRSSNTFVLRRDTAMLSLLTFTGIRLGEFISLEVRDIDFEKHLLCVRSATSKSKHTRTIPIHPTLLLHLRDYVAERNKRKYKTHYLIVSSHADKQLSRHGLKNWIKAIRKKAGVRFHLHQFRHTFACNLARKNVNAVKIQRLLGHSSLNMTMTYLRSMESDDMREEINRLAI